MLRAIIKMLFLILLYMDFSLASVFHGPTIYLERGKLGVVPCPALEGRGLTTDDIDAVYWYSGPIEEYVPIVVKLDGNAIPGNGVAQGVYDVNVNLSLVISLVKESSNRDYYCRLAPKKLSFQDGIVPVEVIVSPRTEFPVISPCDVKVPSGCYVSIPADQSQINLNCKIENAKPPVLLNFGHLQQYDGLKLMTSRDQINNTEEDIVSSSDSNFNLSELLRKNNTYNTTVSVQVEVEIGLSYFVCVGFITKPQKRKPSTIVTVHRANPDDEIRTTLISEPQSSSTVPTLPSTVGYYTTTETRSENENSILVFSIVLGVMTLLLMVLLVMLLRMRLTIYQSLPQRTKDCISNPYSACGARS